MGFFTRLARAVATRRSLVCLNLDPDPARLPDGVDVPGFNTRIIGATADLVAAYKLNFAFYEAQGLAGLSALEQTRQAVPVDIPVIADAKRADIANSARFYAEAVFKTWAFDAVTVNPYLGWDAIEPFADYADRGIYVLVRTSNPGARDFQDLPAGPEGRPLYQVVALRVRDWNRRGNLGLVVGATYPEELRALRELVPDLPFLVPGIGAQGGDLEAAVRFGGTGQPGGLLIAVGRQALYASRGPDFAEACRAELSRILEQVRQVEGAKPPG
jgi:orotidine-5'-phosphate decarboxylase